MKTTKTTNASSMKPTMTLHKETLRSLNGEQLAGVAGGNSLGCRYTAVACASSQGVTDKACVLSSSPCSV